MGLAGVAVAALRNIFGAAGPMPFVAVDAGNGCLVLLAIGGDGIWFLVMAFEAVVLAQTARNSRLADPTESRDKNGRPDQTDKGYNYAHAFFHTSSFSLALLCETGI
jgi:hypothetical protein